MMVRAMWIAEEACVLHVLMVRGAYKTLIAKAESVPTVSVLRHWELQLRQTHNAHGGISAVGGGS